MTKQDSLLKGIPWQFALALTAPNIFFSASRGATYIGDSRVTMQTNFDALRCTFAKMLSTRILAQEGNCETVYGNICTEFVKASLLRIAFTTHDRCIPCHICDLLHRYQREVG